MSWSGVTWLSSDRNERWSDRSSDLPTDLDTSRRPVVADFDANGFPDLLEPATGRILGDSFGDGFAALDAAPVPIPDGARAEARAVVAAAPDALAVFTPPGAPPNDAVVAVDAVAAES